MSTYIISYDLIQDRDYDDLYEAIKSFGTWAHITESTWAIVSPKSAQEVRDFLLRELDEDDRLIVIKSGVESAWQNPICKSEWLKEHM